MDSAVGSALEPRVGVLEEAWRSQDSGETPALEGGRSSLSSVCQHMHYLQELKISFQ